MRRFLAALGSVLLVVVLVASVRAQGAEVPVNGSFTGSRWGWGLTHSSTTNCSWESVEGYSASGSVRFTPGCDLYSSDFRAGPNSLVSFYAKRVTGNQLRLTVVCRDNQQQSAAQYTITTAWLGYNLAIGQQGGLCNLIFQPIDSGTYYIDDIVVSDGVAIDDPGPLSLNGNFFSGAYGWCCFSGNNAWVGGTGHTNLGSVKLWDNWAPYWSRQFVSDGGSYSFWMRGSLDCGNCNQRGRVSVIDMDGGQGLTQVIDTGNVAYSATWVEYSFSLSAYPAGHRLRLLLSGVYSTIDDLCPSGGCSLGTPTPTAAWTSTPNPYPSPWPTYPGGTPGGGGGPIGGGGVGSCPASDPCYVIVGNTPLPVILNNGTPIFPYGLGTPIPITTGGTPLAIQGGNSTPVVVEMATAKFTAIARRDDLVTGGGSTSVNTNTSGTFNIQGGAATNPIELSASTETFNICLPSQVSSIFSDVTLCYSMPFLSILTMKIAGVDLGAAFAVIGGAFFIVFIIRQLQER
ncbi:MAG TPA: hypothetical protein V6C97_27160 [Oculatellaceae cyanobacterium]